MDSPTKQGGRDNKTGRSKKKGKESTVGQGSEAAAVAAALGGGTGTDSSNITKYASNRTSVRRTDEDEGLASIGKDHVDPLFDFWPEELGLEELDEQRKADGVEKMIYLENKDIFVSTHTDGIVRTWDRQKAEFIERLQLLAYPDEMSGSAPEATPGRAVSSTDSGAYPRTQATSGRSADQAATGSTSDSRRPSTASKVNAQPEAVTALHSDENNKWLLTGDAKGWVRVWDLLAYYPGRRFLMRISELQPHRQPVTHLQYFELDSENVIMSASADGTIALCTAEGDRIGTFSSKGPHWRLADRSTWIDTPPPLDDGQWKDDEDEGWGVSPRRQAKCATGGRHHGRTATGAAGQGPGGSGRRAERSRGTGSTRAPITQQSHSSHVFKKLQAVDRFRPDLTVADHERQRLAKQTVRVDP
jgi:hypothetical protein